jgi:hypothetical protein
MDPPNHRVGEMGGSVCMFFFFLFFIRIIFVLYFVSPNQSMADF